MRAVIDEGVPRQLIKRLAESDCVVEAFPKRWRGLKNGALLGALVQEGFDCLVTSDRNLASQQSIARRPLGVVVLPGQKLEELGPRANAIAIAIARSVHGQVHFMPR